MGLTKSLYADLSCEEVFELCRVCDELRDEAIRTMEADSFAEDEAAAQAEREREDRERDLALDEIAREVEVCWCKFFESCPSCFGGVGVMAIGVA
jgi:hypothetical protein